jgi:hypothetical protein
MCDGFQKQQHTTRTNMNLEETAIANHIDDIGYDEISYDNVRVQVDDDVDKMKTNRSNGTSINETMRRVRRFSHAPSVLSYISESLQDGPDIIAYKETRAVKYLKLAMIVILLLVAAIVCYAVHKFSTASEINEFTLQFQYTSSQIVNKLHTNAKTKMEAIQSVALLLQAYSINMNQTWPFVTLPFYENHISATSSLLGAYGVLFFPIVSTENRIAWENYTIENRGWVNQSYDAQAMLNNGVDNRPKLGPNDTWVDLLWSESEQNPDMPDYEIGGIADTIFSTFSDSTVDQKPRKETIDGPYYPQWQAAPMSTYYQTSVNLNYARYTDFNESVYISLDTGGSAVLGWDWTDFQTPGRVTTMLYPVFDSFDVLQREVVAFLGVDIFWESYLEGILPNHTKGIYVIVETSCNTTFSFYLDGPNAIFLGMGDNHSSSYDPMKVTTIFGEYLEKDYLESQQGQGPNGSDPEPYMRSYSGVPLNSDVCQYTFDIYPSEEMQQKYETNLPVIYTSVVGFVFVFTILVFVLYDCFVEKRQRIVASSAERSDAIVSSLFPKSVKDRLYSETAKANNDNYGNQGGSSMELADDVDNEASTTKHHDTSHSPSTLNRASQKWSIHYDSVVGSQKWTNERNKVKNVQASALPSAQEYESTAKSHNLEDYNSKGNPNNTLNQKAIAEAYPETTVLFAGMYICFDVLLYKR